MEADGPQGEEHAAAGGFFRKFEHFDEFRQDPVDQLRRVDAEFTQRMGSRFALIVVPFFQHLDQTRDRVPDQVGVGETDVAQSIGGLLADEALLMVKERF